MLRCARTQVPSAIEPKESMAKEHPFWAAVRGDAELPPCAHTLGWKVLEAQPGSGSVTVQFEAKREFANPLGNIQGGFLAAMLDDTLGPAIATVLEADEFAPTLEIKVSFLRPGRVGTLIGRGHVVYRGRSVVFAEGELSDANGDLLARASATARIVKVDWANTNA